MNSNNIVSHLETSRLFLVPSSMKYFEERSSISSDIENTRLMMFLPSTKEETFSYIKKCETQWKSENQTLFEFDILLKGENNKFIGGISFELLFDNPEIVKKFGKNCADMGWLLDKNFWNKGFASESAKCVLEFTKSLGVKKMIAQCDAENIGSWRVMEKIGMKKYSDNGIRYNKSEPNLAKTEFMYTIDL
mgnify:FL=1